MPQPTDVVLRPPTDEDGDLLFALAADLSTWEERRAEAPAPLSRAAFEARRRRSESEPTAGEARFVVEAGGVAVGTVTLFGSDPLARHAEVGVARLREHAWVRGAYEDVVLMGLLRDEWAPAGDR